MLSPCSELVRVGNHCADKRGVHHPQDFIVRHPGFDGAYDAIGIEDALRLSSDHDGFH